MTSKRTKNADADEIDELFEGIGEEPAAAPKKTTSKAKAAGGSGKGSGKGGSGSSEPEKDILAELENELEDKPVSRPHTPRIKDISSSAAKGSPARRTPPPDAGLPRRSAESTKSHLAQSETPDTIKTEKYHAPAAAAAAAPASGNGWWGGILSTASAAMKQAEAAVKEIQQNEEAKKWADQVRGNYTVLRGYGDELRHRAMPTFTNILHTIAPPISSHERLLIHITHDMVGYPSLDPLVYGVFTRVMAQVEGGDLLVIQRGQENTVRSPTDTTRFLGVGGMGGGGGGSAAGWRDGPWWRAMDSPRDLGAVTGLHEGTKLCRASAEAYAGEYYAAHDGLEAARQRAIEPMSESNPVRRSDLFLAVQAVLVTPATGKTGGGSDGPDVLFAGSSTAAGDKDKTDGEGDASTDDEDEPEEMVVFAVYIYDPVHGIVYHGLSQEMPAKWVRWLDAPSPLTPSASTSGGDDGAESAVETGYERVPEDIRDIVESGGVDPREWVAEWVEEALSLAVGVVAQRYVARRMGVGAGSIGKGKRREDVVIEEGGGEAARAGLI